MTKIEKMRELLSMPAEELAELITKCNRDNELDYMIELYGLDGIYNNYFWSNADDEYCLEHHKNCEYLDKYCNDCDGNCSNYLGECPYGVNRREIYKKSIIEDLLKEI